MLKDFYDKRAKRWGLYVFCLLGRTVGGETMTALDLRCEYLHNPLGIDVVQPRLSWRLEPKSVAKNRLRIASSLRFC